MGHTDLPFEKTVGSRPADYGCRSCDDSTWSYVTERFYSSQIARDQAEQAIVLAKQNKINMAANIAKLEKLTAEINKRNEDLKNEMILKAKLENERKQNEIKRKEITKVQPVIIPEIIPEIIPAVVATSSLLPLGIIALLLYSRTGRK
tara:strand:- start:256 stop:699 length:444 start_codon:yes stop_codon:yes gene_type:complete